MGWPDYPPFLIEMYFTSPYPSVQAELCPLQRVKLARKLRMTTWLYMVDGVEHSAGVQVQHVESQDHVDHVLVEVGRGAAVEQVW